MVFRFKVASKKKGKVKKGKVDVVGRLIASSDCSLILLLQFLQVQSVSIAALIRKRQIYFLKYDADCMQMHTKDKLIEVATHFETVGFANATNDQKSCM